MLSLTPLAFALAWLLPLATLAWFLGLFLSLATLVTGLSLLPALPRGILTPRPTLSGCEFVGTIGVIGVVRSPATRHLVDQFTKFRSGLSQGLGIIAEHATGGLLHAPAHPFDAFAGRTFRFEGLWQEVPSQQFSGDLEGAIDVAGGCFPQGIVELSGQQRLGDLREVTQLPHLLQQVLRFLLLVAHPAGQFPVLAGIGKALAVGVDLFGYFLGDLLLPSVQRLDLVA